MWSFNAIGLLALHWTFQCLTHFFVCFLNEMCNLVVFPLISSELPLLVPHLLPNRILRSEVFRSLEQRRFAPQTRLAKLGESILCCADSTIRLGAVVVNLVNLKAIPKCFLILVWRCRILVAARDVMEFWQKNASRRYLNWGLHWRKKGTPER